LFLVIFGEKETGMKFFATLLTLTAVLSITMIGCGPMEENEETESPTPVSSTPASTPTSTPILDVDGDGVPANLDCDDSDANVYPGAIELCDRIDQDCDGEDLVDVDGDGFSPCEGINQNQIDCDDNNADVYPGAIEVCGNATDEDCSGSVDDRDQDSDGVRDLECGGADCNDFDPSVSDIAFEIADHKDNDCDGLIDEGDKCEVPEEVVSNAVYYRGDTSDFFNDYSSFSEEVPSGTTISGPDMVYHVRLEAGQTLEVWLDTDRGNPNNADGRWNGVLWLMDRCSGSSAVTPILVSDKYDADIDVRETVSYVNQTLPVDLFIVVDGADSFNAGEFELQVQIST
jgi:hypothetical protein